MPNKMQKKEIKDLPVHADDPILNLSAVAEALGRSPQTIGRWVADGCMPSILMPNGLRKVRKSTLTAWLGVTDFGNNPEVNHRVLQLRDEDRQKNAQEAFAYPQELD
jgi:hypothetical protein